jgi:hypothetical protein
MDDPHMQWLQMACAIWGEKYNLVYYRVVEALGCAAHWSMKSKIFLFFAPIWQSNCTRNSSEVAEDVHTQEFAVYLVGNFYISEALGFVASTCQSQVQVISLCHQHCNVAEE